MKFAVAGSVNISTLITKNTKHVAQKTVCKKICVFFFLYPVLESKRLKGWLIYQFGFALVDIQLG